MDIHAYLNKQENDFKLLRKLDLACKKKNQFIGRFIRVGFTDRVALYVVVDETVRKYHLKFAWGETVYPQWGWYIKLFKSKVEKMIKGRDAIEKKFPPGL